MFFQNTHRKEFYDAAYIMSQRSDPKIMNSSHEFGIGMSVNTLPATLYWSGQNGATKEMMKSRREAVMQHKPDFIIVIPTDTMLKNATIAAGYKRYIPVMGRELYGPKGLKMPPKDFHLSNMDILLKHKIKFANGD